MRWLRSQRQRAIQTHALGVAQRQTVWAIVARLLDYPTTELRADLPALREAAAALPSPYADQLAAVIDHVAAGELRSVQEDYVQTFDHTRKCALYLTYFAYGDTRRRGVALVQFKQAYRKAGVEFSQDGAELPDHLGVVLQFGAAVDHDGAWDLLLDHRAGVEMLRLALQGWDDGFGSPWAPAAAALCATLPEMRGEDTAAVQRLIEQGPPAEEVGLQGYGLDPALDVGATSPGPSTPEFLGMPR